MSNQRPPPQGNETRKMPSVNLRPGTPGAPADPSAVTVEVMPVTLEGQKTPHPAVALPGRPAATTSAARMPSVAPAPPGSHPGPFPNRSTPVGMEPRGTPSAGVPNARASQPPFPARTTPVGPDPRLAAMPPGSMSPAAAQATIDVLQRQLKELREELTSTQTSLEENFDELASLRVHLRSAEERAQSAEQARARAETDLAAAKASASGSAKDQGALQALQQQISQLKATVEAMTAREEIALLDATRTRQELEVANGEIQRLGELLGGERAAREALEQTLSSAARSAQERADTFQKESQTLSAALLQTEESLAQSRSALEAATAQLQHLQQERDSQVEHLQQAHQAQLEELRQSMEAQLQQTREGQAAEFEQSREAQIREVQAAADAQVQQLQDALSSQLQPLQEAHDAALQQNASLQAELEALRAQLAEADGQMKQAQERVRKAEREASVRAKEVQALEEELKNARAAPAAAMPANVPEELRKALKLLGEYKEEIKRLRAGLHSKG